MTTRERFGKEYGMDEDRVAKLVRKASECGRLNERYCNGDAHPRNPVPTDMTRNSELWGGAVAVAAAELERFVGSYGFTGVVFTGLYPTLKRGAEFVEIPY